MIKLPILAEQDFHILEYLFVELPGVVWEIAQSGFWYVVPSAVVVLCAVRILRRKTS
jgi:hypothetical protein